MTENARTSTGTRSWLKAYHRIATPSFAVVLIAGSVSRLPVAMAPLGMVFLLDGQRDGYAFGAVLAACYVAGETVGAPVLGVLLEPARIRLHIGLGMLVGGGAMAGLAAGGALSRPMLAVLAVLAGVAPAAGSSGLQTLVSWSVPEQEVPRAFSVIAVTGQLIWAVAPALVTLLALQVAPGAPFVLGAVCAWVGALLLVLVRTRAAGEQSPEQSRPHMLMTTLRYGWPIFVTTAAAMYLVAATELLLPTLLESRGIDVTWTATLLAAFSLAALFGALAYGARSWPGSFRTHSVLLLMVMTVAVALVAISGDPIVMLALLAGGGFFQAGAMLSRSLALRTRLPEAGHTAGYAVNYGSMGVGYGLSSIVTAGLLAGAGPRLTILIGAVICGLVTLTAYAGERYRRPDAHLKLGGAE